MRTLVAALVAFIVALPASAGVGIKHDFIVTCLAQLPKPSEGDCWFPTPIFERNGPFLASEYRLLLCRRYTKPEFEQALKPEPDGYGRLLYRLEPDDFPPHEWPLDTSPRICRGARSRP